MIHINLLPDVKVEFLKTQRTKYRFISLSVVVSIVAVALVVILAIYVKGIQRLQLSKSRDTAKNLSQALVSGTDNVKAVTIQNQLVSLSKIKDSNPVMSRTFSYLQSVIPTNVGLSSVNIDPSTSTITLDGTTDSYTSANAFSDILKHVTLSYKDSGGQTQTTTPFTNVVFANLSKGDSAAGSGSVSFSVSFTYDSNLFAGNISSPTMTIPSLNSAQINQPSAGQTKATSTQNATPFGTQLPASSTPAVQNPTYKVTP